MASKGDLTKERILSEAALLFQKKGFGATSINNLLSATGIKKGSLYFHFPGKEEIGLAVLERDKERSIRFMNSNLVGATPEECLTHYFAAVYRKHEKSKFIGGCLFGNTALEMSDSNESYTRFVERMFAEWIARLEEVITAAQEAGQVRDDLEANMLAHHVVSTIEGGIMLARLKKDGRPLSLCLDSLKKLFSCETKTC